MYSTKSFHYVRLYYVLLLSLLFILFRQSSVYYLFFTNTILAYIPIELTFWARSTKCKQLFLVIVLSIWILFLPNNFYLITDLFHLSLLQPYNELTQMIDKNLMNWVKLFLIFSSVFPTIFLGFWSMDTMSQQMITKLKLGVSRWILICCILFILTVGIFMGRFVRVNTLDLFFNFKDTVGRLHASFVTIDSQSFFLLLLMYLFLASQFLVYFIVKKIILSSHSPA